jgi:hypothetical protein
MPAKKKRTRFVPPTPEEVAEYAAKTFNWKLNGDYFCAYYESKGWMLGPCKIKCWKSCVRTWYYREIESGKTPRPATPKPRPQTQALTAEDLVRQIEQERRGTDNVTKSTE